MNFTEFVQSAQKYIAEVKEILNEFLKRSVYKKLKYNLNF